MRNLIVIWWVHYPLLSRIRLLNWTNFETKHLNQGLPRFAPIARFYVHQTTRVSCRTFVVRRMLRRRKEDGEEGERGVALSVWEGLPEMVGSRWPVTRTVTHRPRCTCFAGYRAALLVYLDWLEGFMNSHRVRFYVNLGLRVPPSGNWLYVGLDLFILFSFPAFFAAGYTRYSSILESWITLLIMNFRPPVREVI